MEWNNKYIRIYWQYLRVTVHHPHHRTVLLRPEPECRDAVSTSIYAPTPSTDGCISVYCPLYAAGLRPPTLDMKLELGLLTGAETDEGGILVGIEVIEVMLVMGFMTPALFIWWAGTPMKEGRLDWGACSCWWGSGRASGAAGRSGTWRTRGARPCLRRLPTAMLDESGDAKRKREDNTNLEFEPQNQLVLMFITSLVRQRGDPGTVFLLFYFSKIWYE